MNWAQIAYDVGSSVLIAIAATGALLVILPSGKRWKLAPLAFFLVFFVALTQFPLPDRSAMVCPIPETRPLLVPFGFVLRAVMQAMDGSLLWALTHERNVIGALMNLVLCIPIGFTARTLLRSTPVTIGLGAILSLLIELTQLTGLWGLYPCAYRLFDVDDLILNTAGVAVGVLLFSFVGAGRGAK